MRDISADEQQSYRAKSCLPKGLRRRPQRGPRELHHWLPGLILLACGCSAPVHPVAERAYWMYIGTYTSRGARGIYAFKFHPATGKVDDAGLAAGRLWQANNDSITGGIARILSQVRAEWPDPAMIVRGVQNPLYIAVHPNQRFLYTADDIDPGGRISAFRVNPATGKLTMLNSRPSEGGQPCFVSIDHSGKNVLAANFSGSLAVFPIDVNGNLLRAASVIRFGASGTSNGTNNRTSNKDRPHPHSINTSPDNRFVIATDLGLDKILVYRFDANKSILTPNIPPLFKVPAGAGARHLVFHPGGRFAYLIEEVASSIMALEWDSGRGILTPIQTIRTLPADFRGENATAEVLIHPSGRFLYGSNRGHDSIAIFAVDTATGRLTSSGYVSTEGRRPRSFAIDPTGNYLFAANVESGNIVEFRIDRQTGNLTRTGVVLRVPYPASVQFAADL
jgi:6-phosphogluconolactonase